MQLAKLDLQQMVSPVGTVLAANEAIAAETPFGGFVALYTGTAQLMVMISGADAAVALYMDALGQTGLVDAEQGYLQPGAWTALSFHVIQGQVYGFLLSGAATVSASLVYGPLMA